MARLNDMPKERQEGVKQLLAAMINATSEPAEMCEEGKEHEYKGFSHSDSVDSYTWYYRCEHCGDVVKKTQMRSEEDRKYWL